MSNYGNLVQVDDGKVEIARKRHPKQVRQLQPRGRLVDFEILNHSDDNRQPKRDKDHERHKERLHIKEKYTPRKIEHKAYGIDEKRVVFLA